MKLAVEKDTHTDMYVFTTTLHISDAAVRAMAKDPAVMEDLIGTEAAAMHECIAAQIRAFVDGIRSGLIELEPSFWSRPTDV